MKRKVVEPPEPEGFQMTPMIDVTFQLLIFFMLVVDMSQAQVEALVLPSASKADTIKKLAKDVKILNIRPDGTILVEGKAKWRPEWGEDTSMLQEWFTRERHKEVNQEVPGRPDLVRYSLLIRADRNTQFEHVQKVLMIASMHGGVTKVEFGAKTENPE